MSIHKAIGIINYSCSSNELFSRIWYTKNNVSFCRLLYKLGFINSFSVKNFYWIIIFYRFFENKNIIQSIKPISSPGRRVYWSNKQLYLYGHHKLFILSSNKGYITSDAARLFNIGGELLCKIDIY